MPSPLQRAGIVHAGPSPAERERAALDDVARWALVVVVRADGAAAIVVASDPRAVVRNSSSLRQWRGEAKAVAWMWVAGPRTTAEQLARDAEELLPRGVICDGPWRLGCWGRIADAAMQAIMTAPQGRGVPSYLDADRKAEADRRREREARRVMR